jgi:formiminoglutamase
VNCAPDAKNAAGDDRPGLVSYHDHTGAPLWMKPPRPHEFRSWQSAFFVPYHATLAAQIARVRAKHGFAIVLDCAVYPRDAETVPFDISVNTRMGLSCDTMLAAQFVARLQGFDLPSAGFDRTREPGWTVQHYGKPGSGVHALQIRLDALSFLASTEEPWPFDAEKAKVINPVLMNAMDYLKNWQPGANRPPSRAYGT